MSDAHMNWILRRPKNCMFHRTRCSTFVPFLEHFIRGLTFKVYAWARSKESLSTGRIVNSGS